ncbi:MAG: hypothetical protein SV375_23720, partial [Thermodesulfobacteriota bacterium]|nr:hypothetical protein [Thermodesulfobacteriota bacterium]
SALTCPEEVEETRDSITYRGQKVTVVFLDINNDVLIRIGKSKDITALMKGISKGITVNPRGMEPVGAKGIFEAVTGELRSRLTPSTVRHTPWTRLFYPRTTGGPDGETISDLIAWTKDHWMRLY